MNEDADRKLRELREFLQKKHGILSHSRYPERDLIGKTLFFQSGDCILVARIQAVELNTCFLPSCRFFLDLPPGYRFNGAVMQGYEVESFEPVGIGHGGEGHLKLKGTPSGADLRGGTFQVY